MRKLILILLFISLTISGFAQRLSVKDFIGFIDVVENTGTGSGITGLLKSNAVNWQTPKLYDTPTDRVFVWKYYFEGSPQGTLALELNKEFTDFFIFRYSFPYKSQYTQLLNDIEPYAELINVFTEDGANYKLYQTPSLVFAFITYPASISKFYRNGVKIESYNFEVQKRAD